MNGSATSRPDGREFPSLRHPRLLLLDTQALINVIDPDDKDDEHGLEPLL